MKAIKQVAGVVVGAGTVLNPRMLSDALDAGAEFIVSPGLTDSLGEAAVTAGIPFLPGIANASNIMTGLDIGLDSFKFFPRSEEHTSELQSLMRISYAVFCLK